VTGEAGEAGDWRPDEVVSRGDRRRSRLAGAVARPDERAAAWLGLALGVAFTVCFLTGVWSHLLQTPPSWFTAPARPAGLYRITQGLHVTTGTAAIPLLVAKLWVVHPHLFERPPVRSALHAVERLALVPLVGGAAFLLLSGTLNVARWYPWSFFFPRAHYWAAWVTVGALVVHAGAKAAATRDAVRPRPAAGAGPPAPTVGDRRGFLAATAAAAGALVLATAGGTVSALGSVSVLAQRRPGVGPQGLPVNKTAAAADVTATATDPAYRLVVEGKVARRLALGVDDLRALPAREATLPIACVEGWSASARWRGVPLRDLLGRAGATGRRVTVESLQPSGRYRAAEVAGAQLDDPDTLLALDLDGEPLALDHGYPVRLIGPNRPGVLQTKWVARVVVS
jgi:hypothetical protein